MKGDGILVVGSANMDMVVSTRRFPQPGETVFGDAFGMFPGGKGANQAVACARLGGKVFFVGKMGKDPFCDQLQENMRRNAVLLDYVLVDLKGSTGIALITVDGKGQNEIVVVSGNNMRLTPADVERRKEVFAAAGILLLQLEIPMLTVARSAELARDNGMMVILNPAPAQRLPVSLLRMVDILTPNETELEQLTEVSVKDQRSAEQAANLLVKKGVKNVVVTLGSKGALLVNSESTRLYAAQKVKAVDTTAAGDAFNGALAFALSSGKTLDEAIPFANVVGAYSVGKMGAQSSLPTMRELKTFLRE